MSMIMVILSKKSVSHDHILVAVQQPPPALKRKLSQAYMCIWFVCVYDFTNRSKSSWQAVSCSELTRRDLLLMMREGGWEWLNMYQCVINGGNLPPFPYRVLPKLYYFCFFLRGLYPIG